MKNKSNKLADVLFPDVDTSDVDILDIPPSERRLRTETYDFTVSTLIGYLKEDHISIPPFQRGYVWNKVQASRLIESLIINCPIPVIYLSQNSDETLFVIDGNQRVRSIQTFLDDKYELKGLSTYPELEGLTFSQLDPRFQRHILNRTLRCICILKDTHPQIKFDVFERLNTGSVKLSAHELRHGMYTGTLMTLIEDLAKDQTFKLLTMTRDDKRMKGDELVLRFFSFMNRWTDYAKPMVNYLNNFCESNRNPSPECLLEMKGKFTTTLSYVNRTLGQKAFRTFDSARKSPKFNAALYDAQMIAFEELVNSESDVNKLINNNVLEKNYDLIASEAFSKFISFGTTDKNSVIGRINAYRNFIKEILQA